MVKADRRLVSAALLAALTAVAFVPRVSAQVVASERATVTQIIDGTHFTVDYSRPRTRGRDSVLGTAGVFENLGVGAYNGAGHLIKNVDYLAAAGSIVSVEARHTAAIESLMGGPGPKAAGEGHVDSKGLDDALSPGDVLPKAAPFIKTPVTAHSLT